MPRADTEDRGELAAYHVFNRGANGRAIFRDREDRSYFLSLLARHLWQRPSPNRRGGFYLHLRGRVALLAYCLMTSHFHLVIWQRSAGALAELMDRVIGTYSRYYNQKYGTSGPRFAGAYRAKRVKDAKQFKWLIAYVHDNHPSGVDYEFSSHRAWIDETQRPGWLEPEPGLKIFGGVDAYLAYLDERKKKQELDRALGFGGW
jgi:REP element-mobilizing transposase RayT